MQKAIIVLLSVGLIAALGAAAGLAVWGYQESQQLTHVNAELAALKKEHSKTTADLDQSQSAQAETQKQLAKAQKDLADSQAEVKGLKAQMAKIRGDLKVLYLTEFGTYDDVTQAVGRTLDNTMKDYWSAFIKHKSTDSFVTFYDYLIGKLYMDLNY